MPPPAQPSYPVGLAGTGQPGRGRVNGWTNHFRIYGICIAVDATRRSRLNGRFGGPGRPERYTAGRKGLAREHAVQAYVAIRAR